MLFCLNAIFELHIRQLNAFSLIRLIYLRMFSWVTAHPLKLACGVIICQMATKMQVIFRQWRKWLRLEEFQMDG